MIEGKNKIEMVYTPKYFLQIKWSFTYKTQFSNNPLITLKFYLLAYLIGR